MVKVSYSKKLTRQDLTNIIRSIAEIINQGGGKLNLDGYSMSIELPNEINLTLNFEVENISKKLKLEINWSSEEPIKGETTQPTTTETPQTEELITQTAEPTPQEETHVESGTIEKPITEEEAVKTIIEAGELYRQMEESNKAAEEETEPTKSETEETLQETAPTTPIVEQEETPIEEKTIPEESIETLKPDGNLLNISESGISEENILSEQVISEPQEQEEPIVPSYSSELEETEPQTEEPETTPEQPKTEETSETEEPEDISSTDDLAKILKALKESSYEENKD